MLNVKRVCDRGGVKVIKKNNLVLLFLSVFFVALLFALPVKANGECFPEGHVKVLEIGQCIQTDNGFKIVLSDVSGSPSKPVPATFKIYNSSGLIESILLYPCATPSSACLNPPYYYTTHNFSIDLINTFAGIGETGYADVYVRSWTRYANIMPIGGEASFPGLRIVLNDISGFPTGNAFPIASFKAFDSQGNLVKKFDLQRGGTSSTQVIEDVTNGVLTHLLIAFAGIGQSAYATVGFKVVSSTPTPVSTATTLPCSNDVYATCADGFKYLKARCVNGVLSEIQYFADPCLKHGAPTVAPSGIPPMPSEEKENFKLALKKGWNMLSTPLYNSDSTKAVVSTTCSAPATLWHYENGKYVKSGELPPAKAEVLALLNPFDGYWVKLDEDCVVVFSGESHVSLDGVSLNAGWNQIGAPFERTAFNEVKGDCVVLSGPWRFNAETKSYEKASVLEPGEGYFVKVASECTLQSKQPEMPSLPE